MTAGVSHVLALSGLHLSILSHGAQPYSVGSMAAPPLPMDQSSGHCPRHLDVRLSGGNARVAGTFRCDVHAALGGHHSESAFHSLEHALHCGIFHIALQSVLPFRRQFPVVVSVRTLHSGAVVSQSTSSDWNERMHRLQISTRRRDRLCHRFMMLRPVRYMSTPDLDLIYRTKSAPPPLVAYYFNCFPTYFLLANIWVIPLTGLLVGARCSFSCQASGTRRSCWSVRCCRGSSRCSMAVWRSSPPGPHASIGGIYPDWWDVAVLYLATLFAVTALLRRRAVYVAVAGGPALRARHRQPLRAAQSDFAAPHGNL
jgi:hypothetical protein